ncbi:MAG: redox-sensing transcriptional repressor Rex [Candidatus Latescibacteria bacterium]|nr:redox-sensing transcriptional repressor Rex [Candidatus Latescibacterota bacterium]NIO55252.1 redox-sensing transcriptional repressor Rex [Candidatus Latescibacterota bacterium]
MNHKTQVPIPVIRRLSHYLQYVRMQIEQGQEWISSLELAEALEVTSSTVRQDLSWLDISGTAKRGYKIEDLESSILTLIGRDQGSNVVIVGAGNLGRALAQHEEFSRQGFNICGLFDSSRRVIGRKVGKLIVQSIDELPRAVREKNVEIGVIAVPAKAAQTVADELVSAGVQGVLNMSCVHVRTPNGVSLVEARMFSSLSLLSYAIKARKGSGSEKGG